MLLWQVGLMAFAAFQNEVYLKALFGERPTQPFGWRAVLAVATARRGHPLGVATRSPRRS